MDKMITLKNGKEFIDIEKLYNILSANKYTYNVDNMFHDQYMNKILKNEILYKMRYVCKEKIIIGKFEFCYITSNKELYIVEFNGIICNYNENVILYTINKGIVDVINELSSCMKLSTIRMNCLNNVKNSFKSITESIAELMQGFNKEYISQFNSYTTNYTTNNTINGVSDYTSNNYTDPYISYTFATNYSTGNGWNYNF